MVKLITRIVLSFFFLAYLGPNGFAQSGIITTYAGPGLPINGSVAAGQALDGPWSLASDGAGGFYVAIPGQNSVYRVTADGRMSQVAGNNTPGFSGDGGQATSAQLFHPTGVALDAAGSLFIADSDNNRIRKVTPDGVISTIAGNGDMGFDGDGSSATSAQLSRPTGVALDMSADLFIADTGNNRIRKVHLGVISTIAGDGDPGFSGDEDDATAAQLKQPTALAVDAAGNLFIADTANQRVRKVTTDGVINTIAGNGMAGFSGDGGLALTSKLNYPAGITLDGAGNIYIADAYNHCIRKMTSAGAISTVAGTETAGFSGDGGKATSAQLYLPTGIIVDSTGDLLIADYVNRRVRKVKTDGVISTVAGIGTQGFGGDGGQANLAQLYLPTSVALDTTGNLFIADSSNSRIRKVTPGGMISTVAGDGNQGFGGDGGQASSAKLHSPVGVAVDKTGNLFIADFVNQRVRKVATDGVISTVAGNGTQGFSGDGGPATSAQLNHPWGVTVDSAGSLFIADLINHRVRKVNSDGTIRTIAGIGMPGFSGDGGKATSAQLEYPVAVAVDGAGNLFIADSGNHRVRKVTSGGTISTVAGNGNAGFTGDDGPATSAGLYGPTDVAVDAAGNLYITDHQNNRIRRVTPNGVISTFAGRGTAGFSGDGGPAISAQLNYPMGIAADDFGNLFIADYDNNRIRKVTLESSTARYFPQVVAGDGYSTLFTVNNTGTAVASGVLRLTDPQGNPLLVKGTIRDSVGITQVAMSGAAFPFTVPARGQVFLLVTGLAAEDPVKVGWGQLKSTEGSLRGAAILEYGVGSTVQTVTGILQSPLLKYATTTVDNDGSQGRWISYAIANPSNQTIDIELALTGQDGTAIGDTVTFTLGANQQVSKYLSQDFARTVFKGSLAIRGRQEGASFIAVAIVDNQGLLTAIPLKSGTALGAAD
jgi:trimeric autotransporter adhesin